MARDTSAAPVLCSLPKVSFQIVDDPVVTKPTGVHDHTARTYGFNDTTDFQRPESYIRYIEPLEIDLAGQVEYDMDEQDKAWLDAVNTERRKEQLDQISYETFEIAMDRLEKDWFDLTKNIPKPEFAMPSEDSTCAICDDSEGENSNAIVFCDGCNLAVHQDCYGVPYIPEGQWLCRKCTVSPESPVSCILCPNEGGAFKQTANGEWVHLLCAIWIPETRVANEVFMEPITGVDKISKPRWKLNCSICKIKEGACIQCAKPSCFTAFHATCARRDRLLLPMKAAHGAEPLTLTCYCDKHLPKEQQDTRAAALASDAVNSDSNPELDPAHTSKLSITNKTARAYAKTYKPGPPLVPAILVTRLTQYCKEPKRKKLDFMLLLCRYWSLKREARRGAPLLKRLHLEPWTARGVGQSQSLEEREMKLQQLKRLMADMTQLQLLTGQVVEREKQKLKQAKEIARVLNFSVLVHQKELRNALQRLTYHDRKDCFKDPVNKAEVPDYLDIIKKPMCWSMIEAKLDRYEYWDVQPFKDDVDLLINNAMLYNNPQTLFHKAALRIQKAAGPIFETLRQSLLSDTGARPIEAASNESAEDQPRKRVIPDPNNVIKMDTSPLETDTHPVEKEINIIQTGAHLVEMESNATLPNTASATRHPPIGDLEPPLDLLDLLMHKESIEADIDEIIVDDSPLAYLFKYELAKEKPPPPPPTPPPPKPKRDRKTEYEKKRQEKLEAKARRNKVVEEIMQEGAGVRGVRTRTRGAAAAAAAAATLEEHPVSSEGGPEEEHQQEEAIPTEPQLPFEVSEETPEPAQAVAAAPRRPPYKKRQSTAPGVQDVLPLVNEVDSQQSFKMFHEGWILPPDQKRRSVKTPVHPLSASVGRPRKKMRTDPGPSRLSVVSTAASENHTPEAADAFMIDGQDSGPPASGSRTEEPVSFRLESEQPGPPTIEPQAGSAELPPLPPDSRYVSVNGKIVIEELDTPVTRRLKTQRKREEKMRLAAAALAVSGSPIGGAGVSEVQGQGQQTPAPASFGGSANQAPQVSSSPQRLLSGPGVPGTPALGSAVYVPPASAESISGAGAAGPKKSGAGSTKSSMSKRNEEESELSELSDVETAEVRVVKRRGRKPKSPVPDIRVVDGARLRRTGPLPVDDPTLEPGIVRVPEGCMLEGGTLVWGKTGSYPWWPCVVYEDDDPRVPRSVYDGCQKARSQRKGVLLHLVQFFDKGHSWQFLSLDKMRQLGENKALDEEMMAGSHRQKWKNPGQRQECVDAYSQAQLEMETASEAEEAGAVALETDALAAPAPAVEVEGGDGGTNA